MVRSTNPRSYTAPQGASGDRPPFRAPPPRFPVRWKFVTKTTVAIIGGGISGLSAAYALHKRQVPYLLLEAGPSLGGVIRTETRDGFLLEGGPDSMLAQKPEGIALCRELGLGERLVPTNPDLRSVYILHRRKLHPLPEGMMLAVPTKILPFARSGLFSWPGKLRMGLDLVIPGGNGRGDESIAVLPAAPVRAGGRRSARRAAARRHPRGRPRAALDPRHLPALPRPRREARQPRARDVGDAAAEAGARGEAARRLLLAARGLREMVDALVVRLDREQIWTKAAVLGVSRAAAGFSLAVQGGETVSADRVIVAAPGPEDRARPRGPGARRPPARSPRSRSRRRPPSSSATAARTSPTRSTATAWSSRRRRGSARRRSASSRRSSRTAPPRATCCCAGSSAACATQR